MLGVTLLASPGTLIALSYVEVSKELFFPSFDNVECIYCVMILHVYILIHVF